MTLDPLADFGGWGSRWVIGTNRKGRWGIITRRRPCLELFRHDGRFIVVPLDDAGTAAAVLETYAKGQPWSIPILIGVSCDAMHGSSTGKPRRWRDRVRGQEQIAPPDPKS